MCEVVAPAVFEAAAVVGEDAFDADAVLVVEGAAFVDEADRASGGFVGVDRGVCQAAVVVDADKQVLPAGFPACSAAAVAGDAVAGLDDPAEFLDVDVHQLARPVALVTDRRLGLLAHTESRLAVAAQHRMHSRGRDTERESDRVRALVELGSLRQDRLLEKGRTAPGRMVRPARAVEQSFALSHSRNPFRAGLPGTTDPLGRRSNRPTRRDQINQTATLTHCQHRVCVKIHREPSWMRCLRQPAP